MGEVLNNSNLDRGMSATSVSNSVEYLDNKRMSVLIKWSDV